MLISHELAMKPLHTELPAFSAALHRLRSALFDLHGVTLLWKDADEGLRRDMPQELVRHRHPRCAGFQQRDQRCLGHCVPSIAGCRFREGLCTCHAGLCEYRLHVAAHGKHMGTLFLGLFTRARQAVAGLSAPPPCLSAIAALAADHIALLHPQRERQRLGLLAQQTHPLLQQALQRLAQEARLDCDLPFLARSVGISADRLRHLFREQTGQGFRQIRDGILLQRAKQLLLQKEHVGPVAQALGFSDQQNFATWFKRLHGHPPSDWIASGREELV